MNKQVVVIHGGTVFHTYKDYISHLQHGKIDREDFKAKKKWKNTLEERLGKGFEVFLPQMPNALDARYVEWKIWFERMKPFIKNGAVLVGHSLGGIFLAKYLSENRFPKKIRATILVAAPFDGSNVDESLGDFFLPRSLEKFAGQGGKILLYQSKDDAVVPFSHVLKYKEMLPDAEVRPFKNKGHFSIKEFPEIVKEIKKLF